MRKITIQEMLSLSDSYSGLEVQVGLHPIDSRNIYQNFKLRDIGDSIEFFEMSFQKPRESIQELIIPKDDIVEIVYFGDDNIYNTVFSIILKQGQVDFTINENPIYCKKCGKMFDKYFDQYWEINQMGGYSSRWDSEKVHIEFCDSCLTEFLEIEVGETDE